MNVLDLFLGSFPYGTPLTTGLRDPFTYTVTRWETDEDGEQIVARRTKQRAVNKRHVRWRNIAYSPRLGNDRRRRFRYHFNGWEDVAPGLCNLSVETLFPPSQRPFEIGFDTAPSQLS